MEKICLKAPYDYVASSGASNFSTGLWEKPKTTHFHDFGSSGRVPEPQNQYDASLETAGYFEKSITIPNRLKHNIWGKLRLGSFGSLGNVRPSHFENLEF